MSRANAVYVAVLIHPFVGGEYILTVGEGGESRESVRERAERLIGTWHVAKDQDIAGIRAGIRIVSKSAAVRTFGPAMADYEAARRYEAKRGAEQHGA